MSDMLVPISHTASLVSPKVRVGEFSLPTSVSQMSCFETRLHASLVELLLRTNHTPVRIDFLDWWREVRDGSRWRILITEYTEVRKYEIYELYRLYDVSHDHVNVF